MNDVQLSTYYCRITYTDVRDENQEPIVETSKIQTNLSYGELYNRVRTEFSISHSYYDKVNISLMTRAQIIDNAIFDYEHSRINFIGDGKNIEYLVSIINIDGETLTGFRIYTSASHHNIEVATKNLYKDLFENQGATHVMIERKDEFFERIHQIYYMNPIKDLFGEHNKPIEEVNNE